MQNFLALLEKFNQKRLVEYLKTCEATVQERIKEQFESVGVETIFEGFADATEHQRKVESNDTSFACMPPVPVQPSDIRKGFMDSNRTGDDCVKSVNAADLSEEDKQLFTFLTYKAVAEGKVGLVILAGGQGSRLGYDGPKGCFKIGLPSGSSIYGILMGRLKAFIDMVSRVVGEPVRVPVAIMTSEQNDIETRKHFEEEQFFGLDRRDVLFFVQNVMPSFDAKSGEVLFESAECITRNSNGNGGVFDSLEKQGVAAELKRRGVEYLHVHGIDNVLAKPVDPIFIGMCVLAGVPVGNKCCMKEDPAEKVGVQVVKKTANGRAFPSVVEYTELSGELANKRLANGRLQFSAANIVNHFFRLDFLQNNQLRYHVAHKKVPYFDLATGHRVKDLSEPNAIKLEYFIFDVFEQAPALLVYESDRASEFAPVKNAQGADSPQTARAALSRLYKTYLQQSCALDLPPNQCVEILPGETYAAENLSKLHLPKYHLF